MTEPFEYPALVVTPRTGDEPFHAGGRPAGFDVASFWRWSASDLVGNAMRGILAEYLVAHAIDARSPVRTEWDACDLRTSTGVLVEVKSAAYLQSWAQRKPSAVSFDIAPKRAWDAVSNTSIPTPCRSADVYVFALLAHGDKATLDPLDLAQWHFYVVARRLLDHRLGAQRRIGLSTLARLAPSPVTFDELAAAVAKAVGGSHRAGAELAAPLPSFSPAWQSRSSSLHVAPRPRSAAEIGGGS
jgi:hypothetical protein